jgi:hypothetical protein
VADEAVLGQVEAGARGHGTGPGGGVEGSQGDRHDSAHRFRCPGEPQGVESRRRGKRRAGHDLGHFGQLERRRHLDVGHPDVGGQPHPAGGVHPRVLAALRGDPRLAGGVAAGAGRRRGDHGASAVQGVRGDAGVGQRPRADLKIGRGAARLRARGRPAGRAAAAVLPHRGDGARGAAGRRGVRGRPAGRARRPRRGPREGGAGLGDPDQRDGARGRVAAAGGAAADRGGAPGRARDQRGAQPVRGSAAVRSAVAGRRPSRSGWPRRRSSRWRARGRGRGP